MSLLQIIMGSFSEAEYVRMITNTGYFSGLLNINGGWRGNNDTSRHYYWISKCSNMKCGLLNEILLHFNEDLRGNVVLIAAGFIVHLEGVVHLVYKRKYGWGRISGLINFVHDKNS